MKDLQPNFSIEKDKQENRPVELYQIFLDDETLYLASHNSSVPFYDERGLPTTYLSIGISRTSINTNLGSQVDECTVGIDNVNLAMSSYIAHTEFRGRKARILKVMLDALDDPNNYALLFEGKMDEPFITEQSMSVRVSSRLDTLTIATPRRKFQRLCNWKFGSEECGVDLASETVTGIVSRIVEEGRTFGLEDREEIAGYFDGGILEINGHKGKIIKDDNVDQTAKHITIEFSIPSVRVGDPYKMRRGCEKTKANCDKFNNFSNYGGFLSIPTNRVKANV